MAWVAYIVARDMGPLVLLMEASGPRDPRARSSWRGMPILAAWRSPHWERLW